jgi:CHRD domain
MRTRLVPLVVLVALGLPAASPASKVAVKTISAKLTPGAVRPRSAAAASGSVVVRLNVKQNKACWTISVKGSVKPLSAHVHEGKPGANGPVVIPLGDIWKQTGCVTVPRKSIAAVAASPKGYYVDVHTPGKFINGLVRGQLRAGV